MACTLPARKVKEPPTPPTAEPALNSTSPPPLLPPAAIPALMIVLPLTDASASPVLIKTDPVNVDDAELLRFKFPLLPVVLEPVSNVCFPVVD